jgi:hypothetical protein
MTRYSLVPVLWVCLVLASPQALAKTSSIAGASDDTSAAEIVGGEEDPQPAAKPAAKPGIQSLPAKGKQQTQYRDQPNGKAAPRWHRFIPGMIR